jgi:flagellar biosynthesis component FlhA
MDCASIKRSLHEADLLSKEAGIALMNRLKGKTLNVFEAIISSKDQLKAVKKILQDVLNDIILKDVRQKYREIFLSIARKCGCEDIKFAPLEEFREDE